MFACRFQSIEGPSKEPVPFNDETRQPALSPEAAAAAFVERWMMRELGPNTYRKPEDFEPVYTVEVDNGDGEIFTFNVFHNWVPSCTAEAY